MPVFAKILLVTLALLAGQELLRRGGRWLAFLVFLVLPAALTPYWCAADMFDWFQWVKGYSVFLSAAWVAVLRSTRLGERPWARATIPLLLAANMLEAIARDASAGGAAHLLNAAAGVILVAAVPFGSTRTWIDPHFRDMHSDTSRTWIIGYTMWNGTFVFLSYPQFFGHHIAVLAASLAVGLVAPHRWTQARVHTLGLHLLVSASFYPDIFDWLDTKSWTDEIGGLAAAGVSFGIAATVALLPRHELVQVENRAAHADPGPGFVNGNAVRFV